MVKNMSEIKKIKTAVFPAAGMGTRIFPQTMACPKEFLPLVDRPLIQRAVEEAKEAGITKFVFVVNAEKEDLLRRHFEENQDVIDLLLARGKTKEAAKAQAAKLPKDAIRIVYQEKPLGLGHAVWCAKDEVGNEPFAVLLPDDIVLNTEHGCMRQMVDAYSKVGGNIVATCKIDPKDSSKYGILDIESRNGNLSRLRGLVEKPSPDKAPSDMSIYGQYILQPEIFAFLEKKEIGAGGEIQLTDAMAKLIVTQPFHGLAFAGERHDCGSIEGLIIANIAFSRQDAALWDRIAPHLRALL